MKMKDFRECRQMPFVKRGMKVLNTHANRWGRVAGANRSCNLNIIYDGESFSKNCHPKWNMSYFDENAKLVAEYGK